jgi:hypothetical protein
MKQLIHYSSSGRIEALVTLNGREGMRAGLTPQLGTLAVEVENIADVKGAEDIEAFRRFARNRTVQLSAPARGVLIEKK